MHIIRVDIGNFRCIKHFTWHPNEGHNILIGPSNCGKSTIIDALRLLLSPEHSRLSEEDFTHFDVHNLARHPGTSSENAIRIGASLWLSEEEWQSFAELDEPRNTHLPSWDPPETADSTAVFDAQGSMLRVALFYDWDRPDPDDRVAAFFPKTGTPTSGDCVRLGRRHREALGFWVAPYDDPLWQIASLSRRSQLSRAAERSGWDPLKSDAVPQFVAQLISQTHELADKAQWTKLQELSDEIRRVMRAVLPAADLPDLGITAALTDAWVQRMLELGTKHDGGNTRIPLSRQGAGTQRAFLIAAHAVCRQAGKEERSRKQAGKEDAEQRDARTGCIAVDEPEVGLHPQAQRALLEALGARESASQLVAATHSPAVAEWAAPASVWVLANDKGTVGPTGLAACHTKTETQVRKNAARFWPQIVPALFARAALIVDGSTEMGALPVFDTYLARKRADVYQGIDSYDIAFVPAGGTGNIAPIATVLRHFGKGVIALQDFDLDKEHEREQVESAADFVLLMPDQNDARDFEALLALDISPGALKALLADWPQEHDHSLRQWVLDSLGELREVRNVVLTDTASDDEVPDCMANLLADNQHGTAIRNWFRDTCRKRKGAFWGRIWAQACVEQHVIPHGVRDLFTQIAAFVKAGYRTPGAKVYTLKVGPPE
jgi:energy-coupling factor transporter ATP-binding protein EcfA2